VPAPESPDSRFAQIGRDALASGAIAALASSVALLAFGQREAGDSAAPMNGPSQWIWGRYAPYRKGYSWRYTAVGYAVHHFAATFWAFLYEALRPGRRGAGAPADAAAAIATAAIANVVDYRFTPQRLQPGYEKRLSRRSLFVVYAAFAAGLAAGALRHRR
jgi:hypothetical protein